MDSRHRVQAWLLKSDLQDIMDQRKETADKIEADIQRELSRSALVVAGETSHGQIDDDGGVDEVLPESPKVAHKALNE